MSALDADVAVVGTGAWGSSALWRLARRGLRVLGFDTQAVPHPYGSSHGKTRMFRVLCHEHPGLTPVAQRARDLWIELGELSGERFLAQSGMLTIGPETGSAIRNTTIAAQKAGVALTHYTVDEVRERWPQHGSLEEHYVGIFDSTAGTVLVEEALLAAVRAAREAGAVVHENTKVLDVIGDGDAVILRTEDRDYRVSQVVLSAGAWMPKLAKSFPFQPRRNPMYWWKPKSEPEAFAIDRFPAFSRHFDETHRIWGHGVLEGMEHLKVGASDDPLTNYAVDPDTMSRGMNPHVDWSLLSGVLPRTIPGLDPTPILTAPCVITKTPDEQFIVGRHPEQPRVIVAGGDSGHGFKHAPAIGELLAQIVVGEELFADIDFMAPDRFQ